MKFTKSFYVKLGFLFVPVIGLYLWPIVEKKSNSIGGGSYDLTKLYAGFSMLGIIILWTFAILIILMVNNYKNKLIQVSEDKSLILSGIALFVVIFIILSNTWFT